MTSEISGEAMIAGVVGDPIRHSLSPRLHNAWIDAAGLDAAYAPFRTEEPRFAAFIEGFRGGAVRGLNVTLPFKRIALSAADEVSAAAEAAGAANLLLFHRDGRIEARNTDGEGLLYAFARQAPMLDLTAHPLAIIGAGGAARGAAAALHEAGVTDIRIINRTRSKAEALTERLTGATAWSFDHMPAAFDGVGVVINATSAEVASGSALEVDFAAVTPGAVAMDMVYRPLKTRFLAQAQAAGLQTVDGLDMLIGQAIPSFQAFFGQPPPSDMDARALLIAAMERPL